MSRIMYDSTTASDLPAHADLLLGYVDGIETHNNYNEVRARFPQAHIVKCTVTGGTLDAQVGDIENGDMSPHSGAAWAGRKLAAKQHPTLYMNLSAWPAVLAAVHAAGLTGRVSYLVAGYDGRAIIPAGAVGKQYVDHGPRGEHYDISIVADYWPGVDAAALPTFTYRRVLRRGMVSADIIALKRRLRALGYHPRFMGIGPYFSRGLYAAVRDFQHDRNLLVDGVVGPITGNALSR